MQKNNNKTFLTISLFCIFISTSPIFSTISSVRQLGFMSGDIADPESDTLFVNPAYGSTVSNARLSTNFYLAGDPSDIGSDCWSSNTECQRGLFTSGYLDLHYLQPISSSFGFLINARPLIRHLYYETGATEKYIAMDGAGGIWFRPIEKLTLGFSGEYFSKRFADQPGFLSQTERGLDMYLLRAGFSMDLSSKWNIGYSIDYRQKNRISSILSTLSAPDFVIAGSYPSIHGEFANAFFHDVIVRGRFNEILALDNQIQFSAGDNNAELGISSILKIKTNVALFMAGLKYSLYYGNYNLSSWNARFVNNSVDVFTAADIYLLSWLNLRLGMSVFHFAYLSEPWFYLDPWFRGGVVIKFSDAFHFETYLSGIRLGTRSPGQINFQLSYNFKK